MLLVLLTASCLLLRSFEKMRSVDLGYQPEHVTTASYSLPQKQYAKQSQIDEFNRELLRRLNALPGVTQAALTSLLPAGGNDNNQTFVVEGYTPPKGADMNLATVTQVIGNFFPTMGIPLLRGRFFTDADRHGSQLVLIVNHRLAQHFWPGQDPIGKRLRIGTPEMQTPWLTVVGEVADVKLTSPDEPANMQYYMPGDQAEDDIGSLGSPTDLNGNGGFIALQVVSAAGADGKRAARDGAVHRSAAAAHTGADDGTGGVAQRGAAALQHGSDRELCVCGSLAGGAGNLQRDLVFCGVAGAGDGDPHGAWIAARVHCVAGLGVGRQAGRGGVRDRAGRCSGGFAAAAVASIRCEPVRSGGVVSGSGGRAAAGRGGFRAACAAGCIHRSHACVARGIV